MHYETGLEALLFLFTGRMVFFVFKSRLGDCGNQLAMVLLFWCLLYAVLGRGCYLEMEIIGFSLENSGCEARAKVSLNFFGGGES